MELKLHVNNAFWNSLQNDLAEKGVATDQVSIMKDALALFNWAVGQANAGRLVMSVDKEGGDAHVVRMPTLFVPGYHY